MISPFVNIRAFLLFLSLVLGLLSCNLPKLARKEGPFLYKTSIVVKEKRERRLFAGDLDGYIKQRPNSKLFTLNRTGLRFYKLGTRFPNSWVGRQLQTKLGESPVILDSSLIEASLFGMRNFLRTQGYYYPELSFTVSGKLHKKKLKYIISTGKAYHIYRTESHIADKKVDSLVEGQKEFSHIRLGDPVKFENMLKEKNRINDLLRNNGYFSFTKEFVTFDFDTAMGNLHAMLACHISNPEGFLRYKTYQINHISIIIENGFMDSLENDSFVLPNFLYKPNGFPLTPDILNRVLLIEPKKLFSQENANFTFGRLNELQLFRSVSMVAIPSLEQTDSPKVDYVIRLQPAKKYDFTFEPQAITSDQSNLATGSTGRNYGFASQVSIANKNIFHHAEILQLTYRASIEAQRGANISTRPFFNSFESNLTASLIFPKLLWLKALDKRWTSSSNRSMLSASTIWEQNVNWIRNVYALGFTWQRNRKYYSQYFTPIEISYIKTKFNNEELELQSKNDPYLQSVFSNNLVTSFKYGFVFNNASNPKKIHYLYVKWDVLELAGTLVNQAYKLLNINLNDSGFYSFYGVRYFQYAKTFADIRYNRYLDYNNRLASRFAIGVALPYGNSPDFVPFDKRFFTGGANSIRAFLPRSVGPGAYNSDGNLDRSGDIRLEGNVELRFNLLNHYFEGALFVDAGNIWRIKNDGRSEAEFGFNTFYKQLAIGTGFGLRLNLDFLILRVDASFPLSDPRKPEGERNLLKGKKALSAWESTIFNFGVGYPF